MALGVSSLALLAAMASFAVAVVSPITGLAMLAFLAPLRPPLVIPSPGFAAFLAGSTVLGCLYRLPIDRPHLRLPAPLLLLVAFCAYVTLQQSPEMLGGYAGDEAHAIAYVYGQLITSLGLIVAGAYLLRGRSAAPFLAAGLCSALVAAGLAFVTFGEPSEVSGPLSNLVGISDAAARSVGPFGDPNYFAVYQATAIVLAVSWAVTVTSRRMRLALLGVAGVLAATFAVSLSRGGLLALFLGLFGLAFARSRRTGFIAIAVGLILIAVAFPIYVDWRVSADASGASAQAYNSLAESDQARVAAGLAAPQLFAQSPIFGIGFGHYPFESAWFVGFPIESHNWYLDVLAEEGLIGISLWVSMLAAVVLALHRTAQPARSIGYAVLIAYAVGCLSLQPPDSFQTSGLAALAIVAALVARWPEPVVQRSSAEEPGSDAPRLPRRASASR